MSAIKELEKILKTEVLIQVNEEIKKIEILKKNMKKAKKTIKMIKNMIATKIITYFI